MPTIDTRTYIKAIALFWSFVLAAVAMALSLPADASDFDIEVAILGLEAILVAASIAASVSGR